VADTKVVELSGHASRAGDSGGGCSLAFSLPFLAAGAAIVAVALGAIPVDPRSVHAPSSVIGAAGLAFFLGGAAVAGRSVAAMIRAARCRRAAETNPDQPWLADYPWRPEGTSASPFGSAIVSFFGAGFLAIFLAPFHFWAFRAGGGPIVILVVLLFDAIGVGLVASGFYRLGQAARYGTSRLRFETFPFFLGSGFSARLLCRHSLSRFSNLTATLRYVVERSETRGSGKNRSRQNVAYRHYADDLVFPAGSLPDGARELELSFRLPEGDYPTRLADAGPRYWEIAVTGVAPGIDYAATFLIPVYSDR
jgi:hypothetical protein